MERAPVRCAVLLSGSGRTLENFLGKISAGELPLEIVAVVSSRSQVRGVTLAEQYKLPVAVFPRKQFESITAHNEAINAWLWEFQPEIIILAGYLCFYLPPAGFSGPVVNIHPALLPHYGGKGFYGDRVHQAVLEAGENQSGCTVHLVDGAYDTGQILGQQTVPVFPEDDVHRLAARVFAAECDLYPRVLKELALKIRGE